MIKYIGKCLLVNAEEGAEGKKILVVGDLHLGYEEVLNESGVFVTREMFKDMIEYLDKVFDKVGKVEYVILLGDVKHDFGRILRQERNDLLMLFKYLEKKLDKVGEIVIVKGNHDKIVEPIANSAGIRVVDYFIFGECCFVHGDKKYEEMYDKNIKIWIMGHGHPAVKVGDRVRVEKYKCFLVGNFKGREVIIVPSFFEYGEGSDPRENDLRMVWNFDYDRFDVKVVGVESDLEVMDFGKLGKLL